MICENNNMDVWVFEFSLSLLYVLISLYCKYGYRKIMYFFVYVKIYKLIS